MKKVIILSVAAIAVLFVSLAINTNVKNNSISVNLKTALQSANAAELFTHDCTDAFTLGIYTNLKESDLRWWNGATIYVGVSKSGFYGNETINANKLVCLLGGGHACTNPKQSLTTYYTTSSYDPETGQTTTSNGSRTRDTKFFGVVF